MISVASVGSLSPECCIFGIVYAITLYVGCEAYARQETSIRAANGRVTCYFCLFKSWPKMLILVHLLHLHQTLPC